MESLDVRRVKFALGLEVDVKEQDSRYKARWHGDQIQVDWPGGGRFAAISLPVTCAVWPGVCELLPDGDRNHDHTHPQTLDLLPPGEVPDGEDV